MSFSSRLPSRGSLSSHLRTRANIASVVAIVGSATQTPPSPRRYAKSSAATNAASVLPSPMGASITSRPGSFASHATRSAAFCMGLGSIPAGRPNLFEKNSPNGSTQGLCSDHGAGMCALAQARSSLRRSVAASMPSSTSQTSSSGNRSLSLASQSLMITMPVSRLSTATSSLSRTRRPSRSSSIPASHAA